MKVKLVSTSLVGLTLASSLVILCFRFGTTPQDHDLNLTIFIVASVIGWILGILGTPYDQGEQKRFSSIARVASAFVTGYLAAKLDSVITAVLSPDVLLNPLPGFRAMLLVGAALLATLGTFVYRRYA